MSSIAWPCPAAAKHKTEWRTSDAAERALSLLLLAGIAPLLLILALITFVLSGRSPWIAHRRVGQYGTELWVLKLRTMWSVRRKRPRLSDFVAVELVDDAEGPGRKRPRDGRVGSGFARFCRRHSLDELPQLLHVVAGRMSLVGPRPVTALELKKLYGAFAGEIIGVKPGLSGLWQVSGRNRLSDDERRALDLGSVRDTSAGLYWRVLLRTLPEVLGGKNSW
jgi:exopolysaccharide production protein ExoY